LFVGGGTKRRGVRAELGRGRVRRGRLRGGERVVEGRLLERRRGRGGFVVVQRRRGGYASRTLRRCGRVAAAATAGWLSGGGTCRDGAVAAEGQRAVALLTVVETAVTVAGSIVGTRELGGGSGASHGKVTERVHVGRW
jgi:hypothetical protein